MSLHPAVAIVRHADVAPSLGGGDVLQAYCAAVVYHLTLAPPAQLGGGTSRAGTRQNHSRFLTDHSDRGLLHLHLWGV